jgi:hypothetical protein
MMKRRDFSKNGALWGVAAALGISISQSASESNPMNPRLFSFVGGNKGAWSVIKFAFVTGEPFAETQKIAIVNGSISDLPSGAKWVLHGVTSNKRTAIFEERSHHVTTGSKYLPSIGRRLHHCRDLGESEPFDFLTLFDYTKADAAAFEDLVAEIRATEEWKYVDREVDIRMVRENG